MSPCSGASCWTRFLGGLADYGKNFISIKGIITVATLLARCAVHYCSTNLIFLFY